MIWAVSGLFLLLGEQLVGLHYMIVVCPGHTHLLSYLWIHDFIFSKRGFNASLDFCNLSYPRERKKFD